MLLSGTARSNGWGGADGAGKRRPGIQREEVAGDNVSGREGDDGPLPPYCPQPDLTLGLHLIIEPTRSLTHQIGRTIPKPTGKQFPSPSIPYPNNCNSGLTYVD
ncbi:hypothetical protein ACFX13_015710 [Malus domestica]